MNPVDNPKLRIGALVSQELLDSLEELFPIRNCIPRLGVPMEETWQQVGTRNLIDFLRTCCEEAQDHRYVSVT